MKTLILTAMALSFSFSSSASDLNQNALKTLIESTNLTVVGDVHSYETFYSIYTDAVKGGANIENTCEIKNEKVAECVLWLTYDMGETALSYNVYLPGNKLVSNRLQVSRGH